MSYWGDSDIYKNYTAKDCEKLMDEFTQYDEKIIKGLIVQVYYYFTCSIDIVLAYDTELNKMAQNHEGVSTGQQGIINNRRDIDFEFSKKEDAENFINSINNTLRFYIHEKANVKGQLVEKMSLQDMENKKTMLKKINCSESVCLTL